jgi:putative ubiquitin-RnfH superfamily antitoxin RatB of RatAB toxin-antitoxin module
LWAGVEAVVHLLQQLRVIGAEKKDLKKARKREEVDIHRPTIIDPGLDREEVKESFNINAM